MYLAAVSVRVMPCDKSNSWMGDIITNIPGCREEEGRIWRREAGEQSCDGARWPDCHELIVCNCDCHSPSYSYSYSQGEPEESGVMEDYPVMNSLCYQVLTWHHVNSFKKLYLAKCTASAEWWSFLNLNTFHDNSRLKHRCYNCCWLGLISFSHNFYHLFPRCAATMM